MAAIQASQLVLAGVATTLGAAYVNAKLALGHDIRQISYQKSFDKRLGKRLRDVRDEVTIYRILELADSEAEALWFEGRTWNYSAVLAEVDRLAWVLRAKGVKSGDFVAVFMTNSPEMVFTTYAIAKLGAIAALLNATLRRDTLSHCINVANASLVIATPDTFDFLEKIELPGPKSLNCLSLNLGSFKGVVPSWTGADPTGFSIDQSSLEQVVAPVDFVRPKRKASDISVLIYTSGTTGKPKAVSIKNFQLMVVSLPLSNDLADPKRYLPVRTFSSLPLFHATCLFTGLAYSAGISGAFCVSRKFSASNFSKDLIASRATRMLYVGELCRYLLATPASPNDKLHKCIVAVGNGLQRDIWEKFKERYNIPEIREFYRSTEGVAKFDNITVGAAGAGRVGFSGPLGRYMENGTYLVKYDYGTEMPYRDPKTGFCIPAKLGEPGEAIGRVRSMAFYADYLNNPSATNQKLIRDVFQKGDVFQRMGDLLVRETDGWVRFHDRTGDTFRWKGENVSAGEVRGFISEMPNVADAVVFGVKLQGYDGQLGATGISLQADSASAEAECIKNLYDYLKSRGLPSYAVPRLVRFIQQVETGATFKHAKDTVKSRPWKPSLDKMDGDRLYWLSGSTFAKMDDESWGHIEAGKAKL